MLKTEIKNIDTPLGKVQIKLCDLKDEKRIYPEYNSIVEICEKSGKSYQEIYQLIVNEYKKNDLNIYHFDVYRIGSSDEMYDIGYEEYINGEGVCIIEWANLIEDILPDEYLHIELKYKDMSREMILNPVGEKYEKIVEELTK